MIYIIIALSVLLLFSLYMIVNMYNKYVKAIKNSQFYSYWVDEFTTRTELAYIKMKEIDNKGAFEADDETGYIFNTIKDVIYLIQEMNELIMKTTTNE